MARLRAVQAEVGGGFTQTFLDRDKIVERFILNNDEMIQNNRIIANAGHNGFSQSGNMREIARIDPVTQLKLLQDHNIDLNRWNADDKKGIVKWLRNPDNRFFKTCSGAI
jgi:hypothetical protein